MLYEHGWNPFTKRVLVISLAAALTIVVGLVVADAVAREDAAARTLTASPSPASTTLVEGDLPLSHPNRVTQSVLLAYLAGGIPRAEFVIRNINQFTGCSVHFSNSGLLISLAARRSFRDDVTRARGVVDLVVGVARERSMEGMVGMVLGFSCPD